MNKYRVLPLRSFDLSFLFAADDVSERYWWMAELEQPTVIRRIDLYLNDVAIGAGKFIF